MPRGHWWDQEAHREHARRICKKQRRHWHAGAWRAPDWDRCLTLQQAAGYLNISEEEFLRRQQTGFWVYQPVDPHAPEPRYRYKRLQDYRFHFLNHNRHRHRKALERRWKRKTYAAKKQQLKRLETKESPRALSPRP